MGSRGRPIFDLNELPCEEEVEIDGLRCLQSKPLPISRSKFLEHFSLPQGSQRISNNHAFSHASSGSGFKPFVRVKQAHSSKENASHKDANDASVYIVEGSSLGCSVLSNMEKGPELHNRNELDLNCSVPFIQENYGDEEMSNLLATDRDHGSSSQIGLDLGSQEPELRCAQVVEREEGECSDEEGTTDAFGSKKVIPDEEKGLGNKETENHQWQENNNETMNYQDKERPSQSSDVHHCIEEKTNIKEDISLLTESVRTGEKNHQKMDHRDSAKDLLNPEKAIENINKGTEVMDSIKDEKSHASLGSGSTQCEGTNNCTKHAKESSKGDVSIDGLAESACKINQKGLKGMESRLGLKFVTPPGKRNKLDHEKEIMLGKKRGRQTMFLNSIEVKQVVPVKAPPPRRQANHSSSPSTRVSHVQPERLGERLGQSTTKDHKQVDPIAVEGNKALEFSDHKEAQANVDINFGNQAGSKKPNDNSDFSVEALLPSVSRQNSMPPIESKQVKNQQDSNKKTGPLVQDKEYHEPNTGNKKHSALSKKQNFCNSPYAETFVD